tara:strand:- start:1120 stop:2445 length:1326 start_codon:yes stop_codon:yes gene_type:complete
MFIRDFNPNGKTKINNINKLLKEQFNMSIKNSFPKKEKLETIKEMSQNAIIKLKNTSKQFQLEPEYAKYLGIKDVIDTMLAEGYYAESPAYESMCEMLRETVKELMDSGYTTDEASAECMNRFRQDSRYAHEDGVILPIIIKAAKEYYGEGSCESIEEIAVDGPNTDLNEYLLKELSKEVGVELTDPSSIDAIEEKLGLFSEVSGKSRDSIVGFLNGLEEDALSNGIKFFGAKVSQHNTNEATKFGHSLRDKGMSDEEIGKKINMTADEVKDMLDKTEKKNESMFDSIIDDMLSEEIEGTTVEEAEVVMAVRALADDIQDHVERLGRMANEDIPAIADQMIHEFGADRAATFKDSAEQVLNQALESSKLAKEGVNQLVGGITGTGADMTGLGDTSGLGDIDTDLGSDSIDDLALDEPEMDVNEPAAAGPEEEPLGRAPVEG